MEKCCAGCCHNVVCWQESRIRVMCCQRTGRWIREEKRGESGKGREREKVSVFNDTSVCVVVGSGWLNARSLRYRGSSWCLHMRRCNGHALTTPTHSTWTFLIMRFECDSSVTLCEWRAIVGRSNTSSRNGWKGEMFDLQGKVPCCLYLGTCTSYLPLQDNPSPSREHQTGIQIRDSFTCCSLFPATSINLTVFSRHHV